MSIFHNRTGLALCAAAVAVVLLGAGCLKQRNRSSSGVLDQGTSTLPSATNDASGSLPTKWSEYRSAKLGITIPYPEGWYVKENEGPDGAVVDVYESAPPTESDAPPRFWAESRTESIENLIAKLDNIQTDEHVTRSNVSMRRITRLDDRSEDDGSAVFYAWEKAGKLYRIGGRDGDLVLEGLIERLEVTP